MPSTWGSLDRIIEDAARQRQENSWQARPFPAPRQEAISAPPSPMLTSSQTYAPTQRVESMRAESYPPLPVTMPAVTPVGELKNRTALSHQYTPEAARELYNTPTWVRYGEGYTDTQPTSWREGLQGSDGVWGFYGGAASRYEDGSMRPNAYEIAINSNPNEEVLSHEFAHKWYDQRLTPQDRLMWSESKSLDANPYAQERAGQRLDGERPIDYYNELYAHNAERGPFYIKPEVRAESYPGLYQENIRTANPPVPEWMRYELRPDEMNRSMPRAWETNDGFDTGHWVREREAPYGYFEDGGALRKRNLPQWSMGALDSTFGFGMRGG